MRRAEWNLIDDIWTQWHRHCALSAQSWCHLTAARGPGAAWTTGSTPSYFHIHCHRRPNSPQNGQIPFQLVRNTIRGNTFNTSKADNAHTCLKEVWGAALAPVSSRNSSQLKSASSMLEPSSVQKENKKKKVVERKENSPKCSQRRQKLYQTVQGKNSNWYKHQCERKSLLEDLFLASLTGS